MFKLTDKTTIITGGGSGIGKAMSVLFAKQGAEVHIIELNNDAADETVKEIKTNGGKAFSYPCDVSNQQQVVSIFEK